MEKFFIYIFHFLGNVLLLIVAVGSLLYIFKDKNRKILKDNLSLSIFIAFLALILIFFGNIDEIDMLGFKAKLKEADNTVEEIKKIEKSLRESFKEYSNILQLYEESVSNGGREDSYNELLKYQQSNILADVVQAKINDVKAQILIQMNFLKSWTLEWVPYGTGLVNEKLHTDWLLGFLAHSDPKYIQIQWEIRGRAAQLLSNRKVWPVPEQLIDSLKSNNRLVVKALALDSFLELMKDFGYVKKDMFDFKDAIEWWDINKSHVKEVLPVMS